MKYHLPGPCMVVEFALIKLLFLITARLRIEMVDGSDVNVSSHASTMSLLRARAFTGQDRAARVSNWQRLLFTNKRSLNTMQSELPTLQ